MSHFLRQAPTNEPAEPTIEPTDSTNEPAFSTNEPELRPTNPAVGNMLEQNRKVPQEGPLGAAFRRRNGELPNEPASHLRSALN